MMEPMKTKLLVEPDESQQIGKQPAQECQSYEVPALCVFGALVTLTQGSGSDEEDGCSAGKYDL
jgi:hypothetical protein